jgi:hypothetical protein
MKTGTPAGRPLLMPALEPAVSRDLFVKPANTSLSPFYIKTDFAGDVKRRHEDFPQNRVLDRFSRFTLFLRLFVFFY